MKPRKMARHCDLATTRCQHPVTIHIEPSAIAEWDALIVIRCAQCDETSLALRGYARAVDAFPVIPEPSDIRTEGL